MPARRTVSCLLATLLAVPVVAIATAASANASTPVSAIALDHTSADGLAFGSGSYHTPDYNVAVTAESGNGYQFTATSPSTGSVVGTRVQITPPTGSTFVSGTSYAVAQFADATHASITAGPFGCATEGTLTVGTMTTDPIDGHLTSFAADLVWRCIRYSSYAYGTLRYVAGDYVAGSTFISSGSRFGDAPIGVTTPARTITVTSTGTLPLVLGNATLTGANPGSFGLSADSCSNTTLAPGSSCTLSLTATPSFVGQNIASLQIPDNSPRGMRVLDLSVTGYGPPSAPNSLHAETATDGVWLAWNPSTANGNVGATSYQVLRGTSPSDLAVIGTTKGLAYGDAISSSTTTGTQYVYAVQGVNDAGTSPASGSASASTPDTVATPDSTKLITEDIETASAPHVQAGQVLHDSTSQPLTIFDGWNQLRVSDFGPSYNEEIVITPPTSSSFPAEGTYPIAGSADATHVGVSLDTLVGGGGAATGCRMNGGTLSIPTLRRDTTGAVALVDLDVTGTCNEGGTGSASVRYGVSRSYTAATVTGGDAGAVPLGSSGDVAASYTNTGTVPIRLGAVAVTAPDGSAAPDWTVSSSDTCSGNTLAPGSSCSTTFTTTPSTAGAHPAVAVFPDDTSVAVRSRDLTVTGLTAPVAPSALGASRSGGKAQLSWTDPGTSSQRATSFQVLRGTSAADARVLATVTPPNQYGVTSWTDPDTSDGVRYYAVRGINAAGTGPQTSSTLDLATRAPTNLFATSTSRAGYLSFIAPTGLPKDPITSYAIYRGTSPTTMKLVGNASPTTSTVVSAAIGVIPGGTHAYFKVAAVTASGYGPFTPVLDVVGPTSQLVVAGADSNGTFGVRVQPLTAAPLATPVVSDGLIHDEVAVSPNGVLVAYTTDSSGNGTGPYDIYVRRVDGTGTPTAIAHTAADEYSPAWSPDGKVLAYTKDLGTTDTVCKVAATGGTPTCAARTGVSLPSWLTNTTLVVTDETSASAPLATMTFASPTVTPIPGTEGGAEPSVSPDGKKIAYVVPVSSTADALRVYTIATKAVVTPPAPLNSELGIPSWAHDSGSVYYAGNSDNSSRVYHSQADGTGTLSAVTSASAFAFGVSVSTPDTTAPGGVRLGGIPAVTLGTTVTPTFTASDALNGVASYTLSYRRAPFNGGFGSPTVLTLASPRAVGVAAGYTYCFSVRATDRVGNTSAATPEQCMVVPLDDRSLSRSTSFRAIAGSSYYRGTAVRATTKAATLTRTGVVHARRLYVVASTCSTCGTVDVLIGATKVGSISLSGASATRRVFTLPPFSARNGTVTLRVTSSGRPVVIDGVGVLS